MNTTLIVIIVLVIAALIALGIFLNERRKSRKKALEESKAKHPSASKPQVTTTVFRTEPRATKPTTSSGGKHSTPKPSVDFNSPKSRAYRDRYSDNYYPSNNLTDAIIIASVLDSYDDNRRLMGSPSYTEAVHEEPKESTPSYEAPTPSYESPSSYSTSSYDSNGSTPSYGGSDSSSSYSSSSSSYDSGSSSSYDSGSSGSFD